MGACPGTRRELLIEAAYRNEVDRLCDAAPDLLATMPPRAALRTWMGRFLDYATAKLGMADALRAVVDAGTIRSDISPADLLAGLTGIALASGKPEQRAQAERLLDLTMDGLSSGQADT
jgi:Transcriptional regulator SbtR-like, C-terminal domain